MKILPDFKGPAIRLTDSFAADRYGRAEKHLVHHVATFHEVSNYTERLRVRLKRFRDWMGRRG